MFKFFLTIICFSIGLFSSVVCAQMDSNDLLSSLTTNLVGNSNYRLSYDLKMTTYETSSTTNNKTQELQVIEEKQGDEYFSYYSSKQGYLLFTYANKSGVSRFWAGSSEDLPEVWSANVDTSILSSAVKYSTLIINPGWLTLPISSISSSQGFLMLTVALKSQSSNLSKVDIYVNDSGIPVRFLCYNKISNFPIIEILVKHYTKLSNGIYFLDTVEYIDQSTKKKTIIERTNIKLNPTLPKGFNDAKKAVSNNMLEYGSLFTKYLLTKNDINSMVNKVKNKPIDNHTANEGKSDVPLAKQPNNLPPALPLKKAPLAEDKNKPLAPDVKGNDRLKALLLNKGSDTSSSIKNVKKKTTPSKSNNKTSTAKNLKKTDSKTVNTKSKSSNSINPKIIPKKPITKKPVPKKQSTSLDSLKKVPNSSSTGTDKKTVNKNDSKQKTKTPLKTLKPATPEKKSTKNIYPPIHNNSDDAEQNDITAGDILGVSPDTKKAPKEPAKPKTDDKKLDDKKVVKKPDSEKETPKPVKPKPKKNKKDSSGPSINSLF